MEQEGNMTDTGIDRRLALAIGYLPDHVASLGNHVKVWRGPGPINGLDGWKLFEHTDYRVIGPIAERYDLFPKRRQDGWAVFRGRLEDGFIQAPTPQRAIALAAIAKLERT